MGVAQIDWAYLGGAVYLPFAGGAVLVISDPPSYTKRMEGMTAPRASNLRPAEVDLSKADDARGERDVAGHLMRNLNFKVRVNRLLVEMLEGQTFLPYF